MTSHFSRQVRLIKTVSCQIYRCRIINHAKSKTIDSNVLPIPYNVPLHSEHVKVIQDHVDSNYCYSANTSKTLRQSHVLILNTTHWTQWSLQLPALMTSECDCVKVWQCVFSRWNCNGRDIKSICNSRLPCITSSFMSSSAVTPMTLTVVAMTTNRCTTTWSNLAEHFLRHLYTDNVSSKPCR